MFYVSTSELILIAVGPTDFLFVENWEQMLIFYC